MINSKVTSLKIKGDKDAVKIEVHQVVHDLNGNLLADEIAEHYFHLRKAASAGLIWVISIPVNIWLYQKQVSS
ncbi:MAG TPA: hypothetical protein VFW07_21760 [Parafilimonas sp.]|nr:hypothetical protein [Parafilimonas sp.]